MHRVRNGCLWLGLGSVLAVAALLGFAWLEHRSTATLPPPTGPFAVGRVVYDWTDPATVDALAPVPANRELLVWIWYPAIGAPSAVPDDYLPRELRPKQPSRSNIWTLLTRDVSHVRGHSLRDAEVARSERPYPVVVLRAGASAAVVNYSTLAEDLASHGYVVAGFDAPYRTTRVVFPDGRTFDRTARNNPERCVVPDRVEMEQCVSRIMSAWAGDIAFVLDRLARLNATTSGKFTGCLDLTRIGLCGHSLGGAVAAQFCHDDTRCMAGIDIDGAPHGSVVHDGLRRPFMFLLSDHAKADDALSRQIVADIRSIYDRMPPDRRLLVVLRGSFHFMFSDDGAVMKSMLVRGVLRVLGRMRMPGRRQLAVTAYCARTFFDIYLKGKVRSSVVTPDYPEVQILH